MTLRSLPALTWTAMILVLCLAPASWFGPEGTPGDPSWLDRLIDALPVDKLIHATLFAGFALLWRLAGASARQALIGGLALAVLTEVGQSIPALERSTDVEDLLADLLGLGVGLAIDRLARRRPATGPGPAATPLSPKPEGGTPWQPRRPAPR